MGLGFGICRLWGSSFPALRFGELELMALDGVDRTLVGVDAVSLGVLGAWWRGGRDVEMGL